MDNTVACVTGASGMIGRQIIRRLKAAAFNVRVLVRTSSYFAADVVPFQGSLENLASLQRFVEGADLMFHCAAELRDEARMWEVNVSGTERLLAAVGGAGIRYFCHLSSAGVVGLTDLKIVDESAPCHPQNTYEKTKWAAEQLVARGIPGCTVVILRPTNVIDERSPGPLSVVLHPTWRDRLKLVLKGGECAHIVHAENVAEAAVYFASRNLAAPECFFVSCDDEPLNTLAGISGLYRCATQHNEPSAVTLPWHMPIFVPYALRRVARGRANAGDVRYTARKLMATGFRFPLDLQTTVQRFVGPARLINSADA